MQERDDRLDTAERRLEDALARFETAFAAVTTRAGGGRESGELKAECEKLELALSDVRQENAALKTVSRDAANRLDDAITQIDMLLEG
ncbi:MAG: hypothetical protein AAFX81_20815 [Pseudomonadota bacterium]